VARLPTLESPQGPVAQPVSVDVERSASLWADAARRFARNPWAMGALAVMVGLCLMAIFAPYIAPHNPDYPYPNAITALGAPLGPSREFPLGVDELGRDVLSRIIWGARVSLEVGLASTFIAIITGVILGVAAGYFGGWVDQVLMRFTDVILAFPFLLFVILLVSILRPSIGVLIFTIGAFGWAPMARIARGQALSTSRNEYIEGARASGAGSFRIMFRHLLPNMLAPIIVYGFLQVGTNILTEAALAYLGLGAPPPTPDWGSMVSEGQNYMQVAPWLFIYPGLAIVLTVVAFNLVGDGLNDALNTRKNY
jgi:peptide/nickel transport system permease protein